MHTCNAGLSVGPFKQLPAGAGLEGGHQTGRDEGYLQTRAAHRMREQQVIAQATRPGIADPQLLEYITPDGSRSTPGKSVPWVSHEDECGGVPGRAQTARHTSMAWYIPAIARGCPHGGIVERRHQRLQPVGMDLYIGVYEGQDAGLWCDMFQPDKQIMNLLAAPLCRPGDDERCTRAGHVSEEAVEHMPSKVGRRFDKEQDLIT